jgi:hypothetical protein
MTRKNPDRQHCTATTKTGRPCQAWARRGTTLCSAHSGSPGGPPAGNTNALKHGAYQPGPPCDNIDAVIQDLAEKQARLSAYIDAGLFAREGSPCPPSRAEDLVRLLALHSQTASRLGRLLLARQTLSGDADDAMQAAIDAALDELSKELGIQL